MLRDSERCDGIEHADEIRILVRMPVPLAPVVAPESFGALPAQFLERIPESKSRGDQIAGVESIRNLTISEFGIRKYS
jgi:hypothetical protein